MQNLIKNIFRTRLKLVKGTRLTSFLFIATSIVIAAGILWAASIYYNIDTGEIVLEEIQRVTETIRAVGGLIVGGAANQNPSSGYVFEVVGKSKLATTTIATGPLELTEANQVLRFTAGIPGYYVELRANTNATSGQAITYTLPAAPPTNENYVLTSDVNGVWSWQSVSGVGAGDIQAVGNVGSGPAFTGNDTGGSPGNTLWFEGATADDYEIALTAADPTQDYTITLPAATGYVALGTGTSNYVAYWTGTNTLGAEQYLSTSRGGTGENSSGWTGMVRVNSGTWSALTNSPNYVAVWDANGQFISGISILDVARGGTGRNSWTQWGVLYADGTQSLTNTSAGNTYQILTANTGAAPSWRDISELITATNGLTSSGTTQLTLKLGGLLTETTTITATSTYDMIFNLAGTGDFKVQDEGTDILIVSDDGKIYFKNYPLAESGKQILREVVPIMGFDLPVRTATTSYVKISRDIINYPLNPCEPGTTRIHKFIIRYGSATTTNWEVATSTGAVSSFTLPSTNATSTGSVKTVQATIPVPAGSCTAWSQGTDTDDWWLRVNANGYDTMIYQIFLAAYDEIL